MVGGRRRESKKEFSSGGAESVRLSAKKGLKVQNKHDLHSGARWYMGG